MNRPQNSEVAMAWYRRDQWELLRAVSRDGQSLEQTYDEWAAFASKQVRDLESKGFAVHKICRCPESDVLGHQRESPHRLSSRPGKRAFRWVRRLPRARRCESCGDA